MSTLNRNLFPITAPLIGLLLCVNVTRSVEAQVVKDGGPSVQLATSELSEPFHLPLPNGESLRDRLLKGTNGALSGIIAKHPDDLELMLNCERARELAKQVYDDQNADPFMLDAWFVPIEGRKPIMRYNAFNPRRETNLLVLVGKKPDGKLIHLFYHFDIKYREESFIAQRLMDLQRVSTDEIEKLGKTVQSPSGEEVYFNVGFGAQPIQVPNLTPLVAGVGDRSGRTSNFVTVHGLPADPSMQNANDKGDASTDRGKPVAEPNEAPR